MSRRIKRKAFLSANQMTKESVSLKNALTVPGNHKPEMNALTR
jgi:hypothetical protein